MKTMLLLEKPIPLIMDNDYLTNLNLSDEFKVFTKEAIIFAALEYSRFTRQMTRHDRLDYLFRKCVEFEGGNLNNYDFKSFITLLREGYYVNNSNDIDDLPF